VEVHETINTFLTKNDITGQELRMKAIKRLKTNLIFNYTQKTASNEKGNLLEYYRGKDGLMQKTTSNNLAKRFEGIISNPDLRNNYLVQNLYPETSNTGEINFKLKSVVMSETNKLYRTAFLEGLNSPIAEIKEFFTDLALGSFMQYGGHFNTDNVSSIVPHEAYIDYTTKSYNELETMRKEEPQKFKSYLTLVRYSTKMFSTTLSPITTSIEFLARTNPEKLKTMRLQDSAIKSLIAIERSVYSPESMPTETIQPSTNVDEFNLADKLTPIAQNFADGQGGQMQPQFKGKSTMDLIISGDRTRTTRANTDIQRMSKDYGLSKISDLVGKVIRMTDKTGRQVYTRITKVTPFTQEYQDATWQKEGWVKSVTDKNVGQYPYAIEFEVVNKPITQPSTNPNQNDINNLPNINPCG
jgi:hypothetical protein